MLRGRRRLPIGVVGTAALLVLAAGVVVLTTGAGAASASVRGSTTLLATPTAYAGVPRTFVLHVPDGVSRPAPLVLALHAYANNVADVRRSTALEALADAKGFVVAFPAGVGDSWDAGGCCGSAVRNGVDDVAFLDEVLAQVRARVDVDPARIGLTGFSNGGMMALRYACARPDVVSAVAVVAAPLVAPCTPDEPVDVLELHGTADPQVHLQGGPNTRLGTSFPPAYSSLAPLRAAGGDVRQQLVEGGTHHWFTQQRDGVDASALVWDWLKRHPHR